MFKEYPLDKYRYVVVGNKVIAISTYACKTVKGVAKCDPVDNFDLEKGKKLAAARCNEKVAKLRLKRATKMFRDTYSIYCDWSYRANMMNLYQLDAEKMYQEAKNALDNVQKEMANEV